MGDALYPQAGHNGEFRARRGLNNKVFIARWLQRRESCPPPPRSWKWDFGASVKRCVASAKSFCRLGSCGGISFRECFFFIFFFILEVNFSIFSLNAKTSSKY